MSALNVQVKVEEAAAQQKAEIVIISDSDEDEHLAPPPSKRIKHAETRTLPNGWERKESKRRPGEFSFLHTSTGLVFKDKPTYENDWCVRSWI